MNDIPMTDFEAERQYEEASLLNEALKLREKYGI